MLDQKVVDLLKEMVTAGINAIGLDGKKSAAYAEANGGNVPVRIDNQIRWQKYSNARMEVWYNVFYDAFLPTHQLCAVLLHEWGHVEHLKQVAACNWNDVETEQQAHTFALQQVLQRGWDDSLVFLVEDMESVLNKKATSSTLHDAAYSALAATEIWKQAKARYAEVKLAH